MAENIFPHFDQMISREFRENRLGQRSKVIWLTGLSGSGKSTIGTRNIAKEIVGEADFLEIYINAPMATCESRDVKGLYKKARAGEIQGFTGVNQAYEEPENPALELRTDLLSVDEAVDILFTFLKKHIILP